MPQADIYYSAELNLDASAVLAQIEAVIAGHDSTAGQCKGRAFAIETTHHRHVFLRIAVLKKAHRDSAFMTVLQTKLLEVLSPTVSAPCNVAVELNWTSEQYQSVQL